MNNSTIIGVVLFVTMTLVVGWGVAGMATDCADKMENRHSDLYAAFELLEG